MKQQVETAAQYAVKEILHEIGEDVGREGLLETPKRFVRMLKEMTTKEDYEFTTFENPNQNSEMVIERGIHFYSLCEHHIIPFFGTVSVAYIPKDKIAGLSKIPRLVENVARGLNTQEGMTAKITGYLKSILKTEDVAVIISARHLCMEMRGVRKPGVETITSSLEGQFKIDGKCRAEFMNFVKL